MADPVNPGGVASGEGVPSPKAKGCIRSWLPRTWRTLQGHISNAGGIPSGEAIGSPEFQSILGMVLGAGGIASREAYGLAAVIDLSAIPANSYWVSSTGAATWANAKSMIPLSGTSCCSRATANANAQPGDTVYFRGGTYSGITGSAIDPANSGTAGNVITFSSYNNEDVQFVGSGLSSFAIDLESDYGTVRSYIKTHDLHFTGFMRHLWILRGTHNEISYCSCLGYPATATLSDFQGTWSASYIYRNAQHNWIHHSSFGVWGTCAPFGNDTGVVFQCGLEASGSDLTQYNTVEDCHMYHGGHHVISLNGSKNAYRNNYLHNEPWHPLTSPTFGARTTFQTGYAGDGCYNLAEGNRIGYGGPKNKDEIGGAGGTLAGASNIWRFNTYLQIYTDAIYVTKYVGQTDVTKNKVYNNTFWKGGYGPYQVYPGGTAPSGYWDDQYTHAIDVGEGSTGSGVYANSFKNNLFYQNKDVLGTNLSLISRYYDSGLGWINIVPIFQDIANNWLDNAGDPKFVDITGTPDPMDVDQFDFNLQASSPCIGAGGSLTLASGAGNNSVTLVVDDAMFFQDGTWGSSLSSKSADWIAIGTVGNIVQIQSINYATNTITLASPTTWADNANIWLYKNSRGERVLYGSAPEMGAKPYVA